ncbi:hypothetical protein LWI28_025206 [Acer negundo]|uniref:PGG domain-containing protein n=1 Tax=Acer negundo TaxID=4023 RepID=A0AAD5NKF4_ACENE|nr:hypothetical protein LWI28_025206 [Acer negundo]KAK4836884.1 hypothetical protein QYF36_001040 [Acer negundo]
MSDDDGCPDLIVDDGGDLNLLIHEGKKAEEIYEKTGKLPDPSSTDSVEFKIVLSIIRDGLKSDPKRYHKLMETLVPISEETASGVKRREDAQTLKALLSTDLEILELCAKNLSENPPFLPARGERTSMILRRSEGGSPKYSMVRRTINMAVVLSCAWLALKEMWRRQFASTKLSSSSSFFISPMSISGGHTSISAVLALALKDMITPHLCFHIAEMGPPRKYCSSHRSLQITYPDCGAVLTGTSSMISTTGFAIRVKAKNKQGHTVMDLYCQIPDRGVASLEIGHILHKVGRFEAHVFEQPQKFHNRRWGSTSRSRLWLLETKNILLVVLTIFVGLAFTVTCGIPTSFPREKYIASGVVFQFEDVISAELPLVFYIMAFISILLTISTGFFTALLYSLPCGNLLVLSGVSTFNLYVILAYYIMPKFFVRIGSHDVSSFPMMWSLALGFIFSGSLVLFLRKCLLMHSYNFAIWLKKKL